MKNKLMKNVIAMFTVLTVTATILGGCGQSANGGSGGTEQETAEQGGGFSQSAADGGNGSGGQETINQGGGFGQSASDSGNSSSGQEAPHTGTPAENGTTELEVRFGDNGSPFMMQLEDNETAAAIARYVGTSDWRLPIYERDDDANFDVMQYYDIPSRYDIPSAPELVTSAKAGEVYYSEPNRIVLFYHDAEISSEYTRIGTFEATEAFVTAVEENPVLEGWENKIILIARP